MKLRNLLFTLFMYCSMALLGQTITPNKVWQIEHGFACPEGLCYSGLETIKVDNKRIFNGKEYYELFTDFPTGLFPDGRVVTYVREEEKKVFFYTEECDKEYLMYDFNLNVGDEVFLADPRHPFSCFNSSPENPYPCELTKGDTIIGNFKITEVDSIEYNQVKRKMLRLGRNSTNSADIWVEGIGCMRGITYHAAQLITGARHLNDCYESNELIFVNENFRHNWVSTTNINNIQQDLINIFTDENNILHIVNAKDIPLTIYDVQGRKIQSVFSMNDHYQANVSFLPKGLYIVSNQMKNIHFKIVIK